MNTKLIFLLMLALGCGIVAAVAGSQMMKNQGASVEQPMAEIVVAAQNLDHLTKITTEHVKLEKWPVDRVPEGAILAIKDVEGKFTKQPLYTGEPMLERKIRDTSESITTQIPAGYKVFDLEIGDSSYIKPGDHVDIIGFFQTSQSNTQPKSMRVLTNVTVLMVDGDIVRESDEESKSTAQTAQVLIKDSQSEALMTAANLGKLKLLLSGVTPGEPADETDNGEEFLSWVGDSLTPASASPTYGAPQLPTQQQTFVGMTSQVQQAPPAREKHKVVVYSGSVAHEYEWFDDEVPVELNPLDKEPLSNQPVAVSPNTYDASSNTTPTGKFTGTNTVWDPNNNVWSKSDYESAKTDADAKEDEGE
jgi:pilus assembly protein CpaB